MKLDIRHSTFVIRILVILFVLVNTASSAQSVVQIQGAITDAETSDPLPGAHVFIGSTMIGTSTNLEGQYELERIPNGTHMLWVSMIGYEPASQELVVSDTTHRVADFSLEPVVIPIGEVTVTAKRDKRWKKRLARFKKLFIGETAFAREVEILNPEVLDFKANWLSKFTARAQEPLIIENRALGYRIEYLLKEFSQEGGTIRYDGDPLFKDMEAESDEQKAIWLAHREEVFYGSFRHFLRALMADSLKEEGFSIQRIPSVDDIHRRERRFRVRSRDLLEPGENPGDLLLSFNGLIEIIYLNEVESEEYLRWQGASPHRRPSNQRSLIRLTSGPTLIDPSGEIVDPYGVTVYQYFAFDRMAHDLPKEYRVQSLESGVRGR